MRKGIPIDCACDLCVCFLRVLYVACWSLSVIARHGQNIRTNYHMAQNCAQPGQTVVGFFFLFGSVPILAVDRDLGTFYSQSQLLSVLTHKVFYWISNRYAVDMREKYTKHAICGVCRGSIWLLRIWKLESTNTLRNRGFIYKITATCL